MGQYLRLRKRRPPLKTKPPLFAGRRIWACGLLVVLLICLAGSLSAQTNPWRDHLTRDDVLKALGDPNSDLRGGGREMMVYQDGLTIELLNGKVSKISGTVPDALKPASSTTPVPVAVAPTASAAPAPSVATAPISAVKPPISPAASVSTGAASASPTAADSTSSNDQDSEKIINDFSTKSLIPPDSPMAAAVAKEFGPKGTDGKPTTADDGSIPPSLAKLLPGNSPEPESPWTQANTIQGFLAGLLLRTAVMTLVLKGAFMYKDFPIIWREVVVVAAGVAFCNQLMAYIFTLNEFLKMLGWIQADQILTGIVLLSLIMNFTPAKRFPTAAGIMMATMSANIALGYAMQIFF
jgi:hypothetical protein